MTAAKSSPVATPLKVGRSTLSHRIVMAPLTRYRADDSHTHTDLAVRYYSQRSSVPGTLIISEATFISARAGHYPNAPGIYTKDQIAAWKKVTDAVHANESSMILQLWALGRTDNPEETLKAGHELVSSGDIAVDGKPAPRSLTIDEIKEYVEDYAQAAKNAIEAGFDAVEIHGANGYLVDQFLQTTSNNRTDNYGGSIENRSRFALEVSEAVVKAVGEDRVGIRFSPYSEFQGMLMDDPIPTFSYIASELARRYPDFAYIHGVEGRISGNADVSSQHTVDFLHDAFGRSRPFLRAGGYTPKSALETLSKEGNENAAVVIGRYFISNPDLPDRILKGYELEPYNRDLFYNRKEARGYVDYKPYAIKTEV